MKCSYYKNYHVDHNQILQSDRDPEVLTVGGPNIPRTNPRWRTAAILKNRKILIGYLCSGSTDFDKIWHADASRSSPPQLPITFPKSKMAAAAFGKSKNHNIFALDKPVLRKFGMVMCLDPTDLISI